MMRNTLDGYEGYQPDNKGWGIKKIYIICDAKNILNIKEKIMNTVKY